MAQETNQTQVPMLCTTGCGFYGNPRNSGMCSVCYKDFLQRQNNSDRVSPSVASAASSGVSSLGESLPTQLSDTTSVNVSSALLQAPSPLVASSIITNQSQLSQPALHLQNEDSALAKVELKIDESQTGPASSEAASSEAVDPMDCASSSGPAAVSPKDKVKRGKRKLAEVTSELDEECASSSAESSQTSTDDQDKSADKSKAKKNRCFTCRKKVGLTGFDCRCGNVFCGIHRYSDIHNCTFDYKADAAEKIRKENPVIVGEKIQKI